MFETVLSNNVSHGAMTTTGTCLSISAIGPCLSESDLRGVISDHIAFVSKHI
jgi:hypothetical protein